MRRAAGFQKDDDDASCTGVGRCYSGLPDGARVVATAVGGVVVLPVMRRPVINDWMLMASDS